MSKKEVKINLDDLEINKENFRHSPLNNELEAIHYLISEDYDAYLNLAKEMQKDCRTFTALVLDKSGKKILMDANRRVSVLKIFKNPSLIPDGKEYDDLRNLCISNGPFELSEITADIYFANDEEDKENLMNALNELHVKDNNTRKEWNALSQYRASQFIGSQIKHPWIKTLEYYGFTDNQIIKMTDKRTDIFNRIMKRNQLKIAENGKINLPNDNILIKEICKVVKDRGYYLNGVPIKVNTRANSEIYQNVLDDLIKTYSLKQISFDTIDNNFDSDIGFQPNETIETSEQITLFDSNVSDENNVQASNNDNPLGRDVETRNTIISSIQKSELSMTTNRQVNQIAHELSMLNLNTFVISGSIILRSFLQYSFEWYATNNSIPFNHKNLPATIETVMNKMFENQKISREEKSRLKILISKAEILCLLNDVTHNFNSSNISKTIIIDFYDAVHPLIKNIYT